MPLAGRFDAKKRPKVGAWLTDVLARGWRLSGIEQAAVARAGRYYCCSRRIGVNDISTRSDVHAPLPLQAPAHSLSGSRPLAIFPQVPLVPKPFFAAVAASQTPLHRVSEHTPSVQKLLVQSLSDAQTLPCASFATQIPELQIFPTTQSALVAQVVLQAVPPGLQVYGEQLVVNPAWQVPLPLQVLALVNVLPEHDCAAQSVPAAAGTHAPLDDPIEQLPAHAVALQNPSSQNPL